jgi:hypothetical protein
MLFLHACLVERRYEIPLIGCELAFNLWELWALNIIFSCHGINSTPSTLYLFIFFVVPEIESRAFCVLGKHSTAELHSRTWNKLSDSWVFPLKIFSIVLACFYLLISARWLIPSSPLKIFFIIFVLQWLFPELLGKKCCKSYGVEWGCFFFMMALHIMYAGGYCEKFNKPVLNLELENVRNFRTQIKRSMNDKPLFIV